MRVGGLHPSKCVCVCVTEDHSIKMPLEGGRHTHSTFIAPLVTLKRVVRRLSIIGIYLFIYFFKELLTLARAGLVLMVFKIFKIMRTMHFKIITLCMQWSASNNSKTERKKKATRT